MIINIVLLLFNTIEGLTNNDTNSFLIQGVFSQNAIGLDKNKIILTDLNSNKISNFIFEKVDGKNKYMIKDTKTNNYIFLTHNGIRQTKNKPDIPWKIVNVSKNDGSKRYFLKQNNLCLTDSMNGTPKGSECKSDFKNQMFKLLKPKNIDKEKLEIESSSLIIDNYTDSDEEIIISDSIEIPGTVINVNSESSIDENDTISIPKNGNLNGEQYLNDYSNDDSMSETPKRKNKNPYENEDDSDSGEDLESPNYPNNSSKSGKPNKNKNPYEDDSDSGEDLESPDYHNNSRKSGKPNKNKNPYEDDSDSSEDLESPDYHNNSRKSGKPNKNPYENEDEHLEKGGNNNKQKNRGKKSIRNDENTEHNKKHDLVEGYSDSDDYEKPTFKNSPNRKGSKNNEYDKEDDTKIPRSNKRNYNDESNDNKNGSLSPKEFNNQDVENRRNRNHKNNNSNLNSKTNNKYGKRNNIKPESPLIKKTRANISINPQSGLHPSGEAYDMVNNPNVKCMSKQAYVSPEGVLVCPPENINLNRPMSLAQQFTYPPLNGMFMNNNLNGPMGNFSYPHIKVKEFMDGSLNGYPCNDIPYRMNYKNINECFPNRMKFQPSNLLPYQPAHSANQSYVDANGTLVCQDHSINNSPFTDYCMPVSPLLTIPVPVPNYIQVKTPSTIPSVEKNKSPTETKKNETIKEPTFEKNKLNKAYSPKPEKTNVPPNETNTNKTSESSKIPEPVSKSNKTSESSKTPEPVSKPNKTSESSKIPEPVLKPNKTSESSKIPEPVSKPNKTSESSKIPEPVSKPNKTSESSKIQDPVSETNKTSEGSKIPTASISDKNSLVDSVPTASVYPKTFVPLKAPLDSLPLYDSTYGSNVSVVTPKTNPCVSAVCYAENDKLLLQNSPSAYNQPQLPSEYKVALPPENKIAEPSHILSSLQMKAINSNNTPNSPSAAQYNEGPMNYLTQPLYGKPTGSSANNMTARLCATPLSPEQSLPLSPQGVAANTIAAPPTIPTTSEINNVISPVNTSNIIAPPPMIPTTSEVNNVISPVNRSNIIAPPPIIPTNSEINNVMLPVNRSNIPGLYNTANSSQNQECTMNTCNSPTDTVNSTHSSQNDLINENNLTDYIFNLTQNQEENDLFD